MKKILQKSILIKLLLAFGALVVVFYLLNSVVMPWYVSSPERHVPNVEGMKEELAIQALKDSDMVPVLSDTTFDEKVPKGAVILQRPESGEVVKVGRRIYLFISGGEPVVSVPDLKGKSIRDAKFSLERLGLDLGKVDQIQSSNPKDMIFDQQYAPGTPLKKGDSVGVSVSVGQGYGQIIVPNLIGKSLTEAEGILADSTLKVGKINYQRSISLLPNTILDQYPSKGNRLNPGDPVDLFVTKASEPSNDN